MKHPWRIIIISERLLKDAAYIAGVATCFPLTLLHPIATILIPGLGKFSSLAVVIVYTIQLPLGLL